MQVVLDAFGGALGSDLGAEALQIRPQLLGLWEGMVTMTVVGNGEALATGPTWPVSHLLLQGDVDKYWHVHPAHAEVRVRREAGIRFSKAKISQGK